MNTDLSPIENDFIPDYVGWENDFDERCLRQRRVTVKLESRDLPAGVEQAIRQQADKNGMVLILDHADQKPSILIFEKR